MKSTWQNIWNYPQELIWAGCARFRHWSLFSWGWKKLQSRHNKDSIATHLLQNTILGTETKLEVLNELITSDIKDKSKGVFDNLNGQVILNHIMKKGAIAGARKMSTFETNLCNIVSDEKLKISVAQIKDSQDLATFSDWLHNSECINFKLRQKILQSLPDKLQQELIKLAVKNSNFDILVNAPQDAIQKYFNVLEKTDFFVVTSQLLAAFYKITNWNLLDKYLFAISYILHLSEVDKVLALVAQLKLKDETDPEFSLSRIIHKTSGYQNPLSISDAFRVLTPTATAVIEKITKKEEQFKFITAVFYSHLFLTEYEDTNNSTTVSNLFKIVTWLKDKKLLVEYLKNRETYIDLSINGRPNDVHKARFWIYYLLLSQLTAEEYQTLAKDDLDFAEILTTSVAEYGQNPVFTNVVKLSPDLFSTDKTAPEQIALLAYKDDCTINQHLIDIVHTECKDMRIKIGIEQHPNHWRGNDPRIKNLCALVAKLLRSKTEENLIYCITQIDWQTHHEILWQKTVETHGHCKPVLLAFGELIEKAADLLKKIKTQEGQLKFIFAISQSFTAIKPQKTIIADQGQKLLIDFLSAVIKTDGLLDAYLDSDYFKEDKVIQQSWLLLEIMEQCTQKQLSKIFDIIIINDSRVVLTLIARTPTVKASQVTYLIHAMSLEQKSRFFQSAAYLLLDDDGAITSDIFMAIFEACQEFEMTEQFTNTESYDKNPTLQTNASPTTAVVLRGIYTSNFTMKKAFSIRYAVLTTSLKMADVYSANSQILVLDATIKARVKHNYRYIPEITLYVDGYKEKNTLKRVCKHWYSIYTATHLFSETSINSESIIPTIPNEIGTKILNLVAPKCSLNIIIPFTTIKALHAYMQGGYAYWNSHAYSAYDHVLGIHYETPAIFDDTGKSLRLVTGIAICHKYWAELQAKYPQPTVWVEPRQKQKFAWNKKPRLHILLGDNMGMTAKEMDDLSLPRSHSDAKNDHYIHTHNLPSM